MASKNFFGGDPSSRLSNVVAGNRLGGRKYGNPSVVTRGSPYNTVKPTRFSVKAPKDQSRVTKDLPTGSIDIRGYFGDERTGVRKPVASFAAKPKQTASSQVKPAAVVRTTVDMKTSPVKTAPIKTAVSPKETSMSRAQRIVAERQAAGPRMAGGKNVSYGFGSTKALGQSIAKSFGGGGQRSGGGMGGGGMRSGGGRATDPSRGGMGNSGRGTGSKK